MNAPLIMKLWGIPFVLIGLFMVFGRFFLDARLRKKTFYAVTTERIIVIGGLRSRQVRSLQLRTLTDIGLNERSDGSGTITFGPQLVTAQYVAPELQARGRYGFPMFDQIERAKEVYNIIQKAQKSVE
jgi:hypothetical protein